MPSYRRLQLDRSNYFFTLVTYNRLPIFSDEKTRNILLEAWLSVQKNRPFSTVALVLLPNHLHCIWQLPDEDTDYSIRWREIKRLFTKRYLLEIGPGGERNTSRINRKEAAIWQRRFWEHAIRGEEDLQRHLDYIHYNPIKHGLATQVADWPWSSFHRFVQSGYYPIDWADLSAVGESVFQYGD